MNNEPTPHHQNQRSSTVRTIAAVLLVALVAGGVFFFLNRQGQPTDDAAIMPTDDAAIIESAGRHIRLPNETPSISTVDSASELATQAFFASVKDGDKILIYPHSARIIIYRPSEDILINVGPIVDDAANTTTPETTE